MVNLLCTHLIYLANSAKEAAEKAGDIDLLVNCAGVALLEPFLETKIENFERTMDVNVKQVFIISQVIAKNMIKRGVKGSIVNVSSQVHFSLKKHFNAYEGFYGCS